MFNVDLNAVWEYFTVSEDDPRRAICNACQTSISRGGTERKSFNTSNLIGHLKSRHAAVYSDYLQADRKRKNEAAKKAKKVKTSASASAIGQVGILNIGIGIGP